MRWSVDVVVQRDKQDQNHLQHSNELDWTEKSKCWFNLLVFLTINRTPEVGGGGGGGLMTSCYTVTIRLILHSDRQWWEPLASSINNGKSGNGCSRPTAFAEKRELERIRTPVRLLTRHKIFIPSVQDNSRGHSWEEKSVQNLSKS